MRPIGGRPARIRSRLPWRTFSPAGCRSQRRCRPTCLRSCARPWPGSCSAVAASSRAQHTTRPRCGRSCWPEPTGSRTTPQHRWASLWTRRPATSSWPGLRSGSAPRSPSSGCSSLRTGRIPRWWPSSTRCLRSSMRLPSAGRVRGWRSFGWKTGRSGRPGGRATWSGGTEEATSAARRSGFRCRRPAAAPGLATWRWTRHWADLRWRWRSSTGPTPHTRIHTRPRCLSGTTRIPRPPTSS